MQHCFTKTHVGSNLKTFLRSRKRISPWEKYIYRPIIFDIYYFLDELEEIYNLKTVQDWKSVTRKQILDNGGVMILGKYSLFDLKVLGAAEKEARYFFKKPKGYWKNKKNVLRFLSEIEEKYNVNTPEDWNSITTSQIQSYGGTSLLKEFSLFELKCMACPAGKSAFNAPPQSSRYWENKENVDDFISKLKEKYILLKIGIQLLANTYNLKEEVHY